jgi:Peptidase C13 family
MTARIFLLCAIILAVACSPRAAFAGPFDSWAAMVVAGDWHAHSGAATEVFDNARRDLAKDLQQMGFAADHIQQFSARPEKDQTIKPSRSDLATISVNFKRLTQKAPGGCFIYFTSHGSPLAIVLGDDLAPIRAIGDLIDGACPARPTVVIVSACFSGMFVPVLHAENRLVLTAARGDRTSFGCGENNTYTFFDQCILESLPKAHSFPMLADQAKECVAAREMAEGVSPPSEPQLYIGSAITAQLPQFTLSKN